MEDVRLPPLQRNPEGVRRNVPAKRSRGINRKVKYFSKLAADLEAGASGIRTTKLWPGFAAQARAKAETYTSKPFPKAAAWLNWTRPSAREPGVSAGSRGEPAGSSGSRGEPARSSGSREEPGSNWSQWGSSQGGRGEWQSGWRSKRW